MTQHSCDIDHLLKLSVRDRKLEGTLLIRATDAPEIIDEMSILGFLDSTGVRSSAIDRDEVKALIEAVHADPATTHERCIARGTPPVHGHDGYITLDPKIQKRISEIEVRQSAYDAACADAPLTAAPNTQADTKDPIDFYTMSPLHIVKTGARICTISPPTEGTDGTDIYGGTMACKDGKRFAAFTDPSLHTDSDGIVTSAVAGLVTISPDSIRVAKALDIPQGVDFSTANIDFPGDVTIGAGVLDNFIVRAKGSISVHKLVQASTLEAEGDIRLAQGMAGKENGFVVARKDLRSGYLEAVHAVVGGDCFVEREITNSTLSITGRLAAGDAAIRGGEIIAAKGGEIGIVGSMQGVGTTIVVGELGELSLLILRTNDFVKQISKAIETKRNGYERFIQSFDKPSPAQIEEQMGLEFEISELESKSAALDAAMDKLLRSHASQTDATLHVRRTIYAGTTIFVPGHRIVFHQDLEGESTIRIAGKGAPVLEHRGSDRPLAGLAKVHPDARIPRVTLSDGRYRLAG